MSGPLSRRHSSSDLLLGEDDEDIPWTYVSTQNDSSHSDVPMYTSEGITNKRRKLYRQRKDDLDTKPTSSSTCTKSVEWTEEEDLSLCQAVSICLQQTSSESVTLEMESLTDLERTHPMSVFSRKVSRELQTLELPKSLAECFVPSHDLRDSLARVKSGVFRRTFMGFLNSKSTRGQGLLCTDATESSNACKTNDSGVQLKSSPCSRSEVSHEIFESDQQKPLSPSHTKENSRSKPGRQSGKIILNLGSSDALPDTKGTDVLQREPITQENGCKKTQQTFRSSSRLRNKLHPENRHASTESESFPNSTKQIPQDSTDNSNGRNSSESVSNISQDSPPRAKIDKPKKHFLRNKREVEKKEQSNAVILKTSCKPEEAGNMENHGQEKRPEKITLKLDAKYETRKPNQFTSENVHKEETTPGQLKELTNSEQEDTKASQSSVQLTAIVKAPLLATVPHLRKTTNVKDNEKRSFKKFRKKFLDRCLEVQHSRLGLTARVPDQRISKVSNAHSNLDDYLAMQQVQQSRKSILDACLMAQRDTS